MALNNPRDGAITSVMVMTEHDMLKEIGKLTAQLKNEREDHAAFVRAQQEGHDDDTAELHEEIAGLKDELATTEMLLEKHSSNAYIARLSCDLYDARRTIRELKEAK